VWEVIAAVIGALLGGAVLVVVNSYTVSYYIGRLEGGVRAELKSHDERITKLETKVFDL
jgi:hypothetical protein